MLSTTSETGFGMRKVGPGSVAVLRITAMGEGIAIERDTAIGEVGFLLVSKSNGCLRELMVTWKL